MQNANAMCSLLPSSSFRESSLSPSSTSVLRWSTFCRAVESKPVEIWQEASRQYLHRRDRAVPPLPPCVRRTPAKLSGLISHAHNQTLDGRRHWHNDHPSGLLSVSPQRSPSLWRNRLVAAH